MALQYDLLKNTLGNKPKGYHGIVCNQKVNSKEELIELMLNRGSSLTKSDIEGVLTCLDEVLKQMVKNGEGVNTGTFTLHIDIKGNFPTANSHFDKANNSLAININANKSFKESLEEVELERVYSTGKEARITTVEDVASQTNDSVLTPSGGLKVFGNRIKIEAAVPADNKEGLYLINTSDDSETKLSNQIANKPSELIYIIPSLQAGKYKLQVRTYYSGSNVSKKLKTIDSDAVFTVS